MDGCKKVLDPKSEPDQPIAEPVSEPPEAQDPQKEKRVTFVVEVNPPPSTSENDNAKKSRAESLQKALEQSST